MKSCTIKITNKDIWKSGRNEEDGSSWYFSGYFYIDGEYFPASAIDAFFSAGFSPDILKKVKGEFAFIFTDGDSLWAVVDKKRSIPLFYYKDESGTWVITDNLGKEHLDRPVNDTSVYEFLLTGFTSYERTLLQGVFQVEAGEYIKIKHDGQPVKSRYFSFYHKPSAISLPDAAGKLEAVFHQVFEKLFDRIHKKKVIIPLSGGYDSRIIALLLKEYGVDRIQSFTYGKIDNPEAIKSKQIAERLGIPWEIIPYGKANWREWYSSEDWDKYRAYATNFSSMAHLQDWPAVRQLNQHLEEPSTFIPGHSADFLAGGHLPFELIQDKTYTADEVVGQIMRKHHRLWETGNHEVLQPVRTGIEKSIQDFEYNAREQASALFEYWDWKERQAKFIINSVRVYEYFGHGWEIPLWDDELVDFFLTVPVDLRYKKYLYDFTLYRMFPAYFDRPEKPDQDSGSLQNKYGVFYPYLRKAYQKKRVIQQYFTDPMEWYGIKKSYAEYLASTNFKYKGHKFSNPYNINSFLVRDYIQQILQK